MAALPGIDKVFQAQKRLKAVTKATPLLYSLSLSRVCGSEVWFKPENLQETGSFKIRGAFNKLLALNEIAEKEGVPLGGVVTDSSGNHGLGVAYAAAFLGLPATVVVPQNAVQVKVEAIREWGAEIVVYGTTSTEREAEAQRISATQGLAYIHSYDDPEVIAGQGTIGLEIVTALPDVEMVLVPIGNGGLISGVAMAVKSLNPSCTVIGVEPEGSCCMYESRKAGRPVELPATETIADGLRGRNPGALTFPMVQAYVDDLVLVTEDEIKESFKVILLQARLLSEPSGAVAFAALLAGKVAVRNKKVVAVISGGNVDAQTVRRLVAEE